MNEEGRKNHDDELMAAAAKLAKEVTPERDLWPRIAEAIAEPVKPRRTAWNGVWAQAAAVVLLIAGSSGITYLAVRDDADPLSPVAEGPAYVFEPVSARFGGLYNLGPDYVDARLSLAAKMDDELKRLTPAQREEVAKNIEVIRTAIEDINKALVNDPDNALLQKLLINTYREELDLMMRVDSITNAAMRRGDI